MKLLDSLLDAIVRLEGDSLVMHVGEKPYVVTASSSMNAYRGPLAWGQVELSSRVLTFDAVSSMLGQILPDDQQQALTEFGAIEHEIPSPAGVADRFTVVAARGGEDVWVELRRRPIEIPQAAAPAAEAPPTVAAPAGVAEQGAALPPETAAVDAPGADQAPAAAYTAPDVDATAAAAPVEAPTTPTAEADAELDLPDIALVAEHADDQPAAGVTLDTNESIVVAIPGQAAEEFTLNGVPDNAIQIVDDEPQGVPTEEEVDAMLAATATALLTSGLSAEVIPDEDREPTVASEAQGEAENDETEIVFTPSAVPFAAPATEEAPADVVMPEAPTAVTELHGAPAFELSPPPPVPPIDDEAAEAAEAEAIAETPVGTPLFSDEAVLAAAPPPLAPPVDVPAVPEFVPVAAHELSAELPQAVEEMPVAEPAPGPEYAPVAEVAPTIEQESIAELPPVSEFTPIVEQAPASEYARAQESAPLVADQAPIGELPPVVEYTPVIESAAASESVPVAEHAPVVQHELIAEPPSVSELTAIAEAAFAADDVARLDVPMVGDLSDADAPQLELPAAFEAPPIDAVMADAMPSQQPAEDTRHDELGRTADPVPFESPVVLETADVRVEAPVAEQVSVDDIPNDIPKEIPKEIDEARQPVDAMSAGAVGAEALIESAGQAASEPTLHAWTPSAAETPMEVTPELQRQEQPVAHFDRVPASEGVPSTEGSEPTPAEAYAVADDETRQGVVVPLARSPIKPELVSVPYTPSEDAALMHTLRVAAARGASTVYVVAQSKPMIRIDGEIGPLESEPTLTAADVDRLIMELAPPRRRDALQNGPVEWLCDVPEIGRVRCLTFKDHRGPGVLFRMFPPRAISADQLGLTPEVQALCQQSDGLVIVTGARASGKSTLLNAFVDLINRTRSDHLITIESQIGFVHESRRSFISQRESRGDSELAATYARAALREDPDVMMIEDLKSADLVSAALEAAESGRLVLASVPASSTIGALERLIEVFPNDRRAKARTSLATALRGVIAQVLLRRVKGGRVAAREILLNTPAVSQLVLEGKMFQLPVALDSGRRHGMVPLTDSLAGHVREGTVQVAEAYRKALDRAALVALLKREGIDTSFAERLA